MCLARDAKDLFERGHTAEHLLQAVLLQRTIVRVDQLAQCILTFVLTDCLAECIINGQQLIDADAPAIAVVITLFAADSAPQLNARRWAGRKCASSTAVAAPG